MSHLLKIKLDYKEDRMAFSEQEKATNAPTAPRVSTQELVFSKDFYQSKTKTTQTT